MVKLIKQSYNKLIKTGQLPRTETLELICMVIGTSSKNPFTYDAIEQVNENIRKEAEKLGASYVLGIEYKAMVGDVPNGGTLGYGDAYKVKE